jgi:hypothetical protein
MKNVFSFLAISLTAASVFATPVPATQLAVYQNAVLLTDFFNNPSCKTTTGEFTINYTTLQDYIKASSSAEVADTGQPLLMFSVLSNDKKEKVVLSVTTTADFKDITSVKLEEFSYQVTQINKGNLKKPELSVEGNWKSKAVGTCEKGKQ